MSRKDEHEIVSRERKKDLGSEFFREQTPPDLSFGSGGEQQETEG